MGFPSGQGIGLFCTVCQNVSTCESNNLALFQVIQNLNGAESGFWTSKISLQSQSEKKITLWKHNYSQRLVRKRLHLIIKSCTLEIAGEKLILYYSIPEKH